MKPRKKSIYPKQHFIHITIFDRYMSKLKVFSEYTPLYLFKT